jgi:hypothetical protein
MAARAKTKTALAEVVDEVWAECAGCLMIRRVVDEGSAQVLCEHRRWHQPSYQMVPCEGCGQPPAESTSTGKAA